VGRNQTQFLRNPAKIAKRIDSPWPESIPGFIPTLQSSAKKRRARFLEEEAVTKSQKE
jgi:hypothetical protein